MMLSAQIYIENPDDSLNFSLYKRPPPLKQRPAGKLLGVISISILIGLAFPAYQMGHNAYLNFVLSQQTNEYSALFKKTSNIRNQLAVLKTEKEKVDALSNVEVSKFEFRKKLLNEIYNKKISYPMKARMLMEVFALSNESHSKVESVFFSKNTLEFSIRNQSDKKITEFIQGLTGLHKYKINTDKIIKDDELKLYTSKVSIGLIDE